MVYRRYNRKSLNLSPIFKIIIMNIADLIEKYRRLGIADQIDSRKFYLYSLITHSTAIEGSTVTELENQLLFDEGTTAKGRTMMGATDEPRPESRLRLRLGMDSEA